MELLSTLTAALLGIVQVVWVLGILGLGALTEAVTRFRVAYSIGRHTATIGHATLLDDIDLKGYIAHTAWPPASAREYLLMLASPIAVIGVVYSFEDLLLHTLYSQGMVLTLAVGAISYWYVRLPDADLPVRDAWVYESAISMYGWAMLLLMSHWVYWSSLQMIGTLGFVTFWLIAPFAGALYCFSILLYRARLRGSSPAVSIVGGAIAFVLVQVGVGLLWHGTAWATWFAFTYENDMLFFELTQ